MDEETASNRETSLFYNNLFIIALIQSFSDKLSNSIQVAPNLVILG
jgi:hypothetical protein